ncbi:Restriction of telomere capping protein 5 [Pseudogymnoascus verrucosus]|uniref:Restriction of telomere capping protein 5 n=1 Tax=Pseudogymnoascus verrucosus TaxID=342668 RepID=A0A1B8GRS4_9PEZI|nr:Restriction of telomere capping protein 5 [Pseudogymnoascus verrucosus]OBT98527.1 Restriction of telomere capping protein 5 [Pseudogymnoascus verrucosus]
MGQSQSQADTPPATAEELSKQLAQKFATRCFTPLELYSFRDVFRSLADTSDGVSYLKEDTLTRFLQVPDALGVAPVLFQMASYLGAFPFSAGAPAVLGFEEMIVVVVMLTERYGKVLRGGGKGRNVLLYRSLTVFDRLDGKEVADKGEEGGDKEVVEGEGGEVNGNAKAHVGFAVDQPANDEEGDDDDDGLALSALESLDANDVFKHSDAPPISHCSIPVENFRKIIMLLLLIAPLEASQPFPDYSDRLSGDNLEQLQATADAILSAFVNTESNTGIKIHAWNTVIPASLPNLFNGFSALFSHFLFSTSLDLSKRKPSSPTTTPPISPPTSPPSSPALRRPTTPPPPLPLIPTADAEEAEILDVTLLSQLSFFLPPTTLFHRLRLLYSGGSAGFSMRSFETRVFNWRAPSLLLVSGSRLPAIPEGSNERAFADSLPPKRLPDSTATNPNRLVFGAYIPQTWQQTYKTCLSDPGTILFQLAPTHTIHRSTISTDQLSFTHPPLSHPGISLGSPHPSSKSASGTANPAKLGPVSLHIDASFEFGVFTHDSRGGGAFEPASGPGGGDWQERFAIESLEVWGCGGEEEAEEQRRRWEWEEREAEARRRINFGKGDIEADRALLEMAGIIGGGRSGGSMN